LICGKQYRPDMVDYICPEHGDEGILDVQYDPGATIPPLSVGWTPLYPSRRLARQLGLNALWIKDDGRQPTASFKDRASAIALVKARESGAEIITTFVPETAPQAKIAQLRVFGSRVFLVRGTYNEAFELCLKATRTYGWYNRNTGFNPYMAEGKKTAAYEICEQLGWKAPDRIFVSVGDGCIIGGLHKGLKDLLVDR
jgi:threonine synthase